LDICASFGTGIDDLTDFFPGQNKVLSRLVDEKNEKKNSF
jgi:hypothetical protein